MSHAFTCACEVQVQVQVHVFTLRGETLAPKPLASDG
jgi:hypothetical protein